VAERRALGVSVPQIARETGLTRRQVKRRWEQAQVRLRTELHDVDGSPPVSARPRCVRSPLLCSLAGR
jgi:hypothetical protein